MLRGPRAAGEGFEKVFPHNTIRAAPGAASTLRSATKEGFSYTFGGKERTPNVPPHTRRPATRVVLASLINAPRPSGCGGRTTWRSGL